MVVNLIPLFPIFTFVILSFYGFLLMPETCTPVLCNFKFRRLAASSVMKSCVAPESNKHLILCQFPASFFFILMMIVVDNKTVAPLLDVLLWLKLCGCFTLILIIISCPLFRLGIFISVLRSLPV